MLQNLAQIKPDSQAGQWLMLITGIMLIGAVAILVIVLMSTGRRWKRRQLKAIEQDRAARRAGQSAERVDAWQASAQRYVDHDKLPAEDESLEGDDASPADTDSLGEYDDAMPSEDEDDERDPYGLFDDKPYQDPEDEDEDDLDDNNGWNEDDQDRR